MQHIIMRPWFGGRGRRFSMDMSQLRHSSDSGSVGKFVIAPTDDVRLSLFIDSICAG